MKVNVMGNWKDSVGHVQSLEHRNARIWETNASGRCMWLCRQLLSINPIIWQTCCLLFPRAVSDTSLLLPVYKHHKRDLITYYSSLIRFLFAPIVDIPDFQFSPTYSCLKWRFSVRSDNQYLQLRWTKFAPYAVWFFLCSLLLSWKFSFSREIHFVKWWVHRHNLCIIIADFRERQNTYARSYVG